MHTQTTIRLGTYKRDKNIHISLYSQNKPVALLASGKTLPFTKENNLWHTSLPENTPFTVTINGTPIEDPFSPPLSNEETFDWEHDSRPLIPMSDTVIYEMHIKGFSKGEKSPFMRLIDKIPYLKNLDVNCIELLPIFAFEEGNYWGYAPSHFFKPHHKYGTTGEFKTLVKALHKAGIEVILDVVFNHTAKKHPLELLDKEAFYITDKGEHTNYSGCGNTLNCNAPIVQDLIISSLRYWAQEIHVDGFRFDLASILTRDTDGTPLEHPPLLKRLERDPILAPLKLIAEPWDPAGLYQVGAFSRWGRWHEWNGKFRDDVRSFLKGDPNLLSQVAARLTGSFDIYNDTRSINFITSHDGFSLYDLVSYEQKHNEANGENNNDGDNHNISWNCGVEGETDDTAINALRLRQMKNFFLALLVSPGTPMITMGDEYGHTKKGNNNTWCQDNDLSYFDWSQTENELFDFVKQLLQIRRQYPILRKNGPYSENELIWHTPDWEGHLLAYQLGTLFIAFNTSDKDVLLPLPNEKWQCLAHTSHDAKKGTLPPYSSAIFTLP